MIGFAAGLGAVMPLATDIYVLVLPSIARDFGASLAATQRTMATFALGFGVAQLFVGVAADRWGRRPVAIISLLLYFLSSLAVVVAPSLEALTLSRFVQGMVAAACPILSRALVRDALAPYELARAYASTNVLIGLAPLTAPFMAVAALSVGGWRMALALLPIYGAVLALAVVGWLPETRPQQPVRQASPLEVATEILTNRHFVLGGAASTLIYSSLFTWLTTSPFLLMDRMGFSTVAAAFVFGTGAGLYIATNLATSRLARHVRPTRLMTWGAVAMLTGSATTLSALGWPGLGPVALIVAMAPFYIGLGLAHPNALQTVMRPFAHVAGQASAWLGLVQQFGGVVVSLVAVWLGAGLAALGVMIACCSLLLAVAVILDRHDGQ